MDLKLKDMVAVITGPAKGVGAAITRAFGEEGCKVALLGRDIGAIEPLAESLKMNGTSVVVLRCDVTDAAQCSQAIEAVMKEYGRIDILVNVAGGTGPIGKTGVETSATEFDNVVTLNLNGCFRMMRAVLPEMMKRRYGKIVNIGGTFGLRGRAGRVSYSSAKWGMRGLTKSFALEAGPFNININCVAPGMIDGPRFRDAVCVDTAQRLGISVEEAATHHAAEYALRRISTDVDVANACLFLASDVSRQVTGADLPIDGGWAAI